MALCCIGWPEADSRFVEGSLSDSQLKQYIFATGLIRFDDYELVVEV